MFFEIAGKNISVNNKSGSFDRTKSASGPKSGSRMSGGNTIGYQYPSVGLQVCSID